MTTVQTDPHPSSSPVTELTDATFDETIRGAELPVLVDFFTDWCPPCRAIEPILDELAIEQAGRLHVHRINAEEQLAVATRYDVMAFPTLLLFQDGEVRLRLIGAKGKRHLLEELSRALDQS